MIVLRLCTVTSKEGAGRVSRLAGSACDVEAGEYRGLGGGEVGGKCGVFGNVAGSPSEPAGKVRGEPCGVPM